MRLLIPFVVLVLAASCTTPPAKVDKVQWFSELPSASTLNSTDMEPIRLAAENKTIVMLAESMRLTSELSSVRDLLVRNLHEGGDFDLLLFEGSPIEFWIAEEEYLTSKKDVLSAADFQKTALPGFWQTEEIRSLINYALRSQAGAGQSDLYLSSYDVQIGQGRRFVRGANVFETVVRLLKARDQRLSPAEEEAVVALEKLVSCAEKGFPESDEQYAQAEQSISTLSQLVARRVRSSDDIHEKTLMLLPKMAGYSLEYCRASKEGNNSGEVRDEWASKQFADLFSTLNQKTMVWAPSSHIRQAAEKDGAMSFGAYVRSAFPEEVFAIHFTAGNGNAVDFMDDKGREIEPAEKTILPLNKVSLEAKLSRLGVKDVFVSSKQLTPEFGAEETTRREVDGFMAIDPRKDFDGYYFVRDITAPSLRYLR